MYFALSLFQLPASPIIMCIPYYIRKLFFSVYNQFTKPKVYRRFDLPPNQDVFEYVRKVKAELGPDYETVAFQVMFQVDKNDPQSPYVVDFDYYRIA